MQGVLTCWKDKERFGIVVDYSSCSSSYLNCLLGENSEEMRLVNELSPACLAGASSIQATDLGQEWPLNLETEDLSQFVNSMVDDTVNAPQKTMQQFSELFNDECLFENPVQMPQVYMTAPEMVHSQSLQQQDEDLSALYGIHNLHGYRSNQEATSSIQLRGCTKVLSNDAF